MIRISLLRCGSLALALLLVVASADLGQAQVTFSNSAGMTIPDSGTANPYPSTISVSGYTGTITAITVTLTNFSHTFPDDVGVLFTGPSGANTLLFDGPGNGTAVSGLTLTFSDAGTAQLPSGGTFGSGTYLPGQNEWGDIFALPAPNQPYGTNFTGFNNTSPDGTYSLFVEDFVGGDQGTIGSWSITISGIQPVPEPTSIIAGSVAVLGLAGGIRRLRSGRWLRGGAAA